MGRWDTSRTVERETCRSTGSTRSALDSSTAVDMAGTRTWWDPLLALASLGHWLDLNLHHPVQNDLQVTGMPATQYWDLRDAKAQMRLHSSLNWKADVYSSTA